MDTLSDRLRRGDVLTSACPSRAVLRHMTSLWGVLILLVLAQGTHRFGELRRRIDGVSERMLAQTLKLLETDALVRRVARATVPPHVEYSLTPLGEEAARHIGQLTDWLETSMPTILAGKARNGSASPAPHD